MYPHQAERLGEALERGALDALVATAPENIRYATGFSSLVQATYRGMELYGVFTRQGAALVVPAIDAVTAAVENVEVQHVRTYGRFVYAAEQPDALARRVDQWTRDRAPGAADGLADALAALGVETGRVGLDEGGLTPAQWGRAVERLAPLTVVEAAESFAAARRIKGPWEIECLQRALAITEEAANAVIQMLAPGVTEREAASLYRREVEQRGAEPHAVVLLFGERSAYPAVGPGDRALKAGELVRFDLGCVVQGYHADLGRTAVMGEPSARQTAAHDAIRAGLEAALDAIKPGVTAGDVFARAVEAARGGGLPHYDRGHVGHGIGLAPYERPKLSASNPAALEAGMVLRVETPYYDLGRGGLHLKDTVLVTRRDAAVMNRSARGLVVLD
jgi:Xaa-Pro aminopeptidase